MRIVMTAAAAMVLTASVAFAAEEGAISIVGVVDDQVISSVDLGDRMALIMGTTGIPDTAENRAHLAPQVLRQLVDEKLQMEEATHDGITISDAKVKDGIAQIEKQSGRSPGSMEQYIESKGLSKLSFYAQVRGQLAWVEIVSKKVRPKVRVSDQEVARANRQRIAAGAGGKAVPEVQIATIQLPVDTPESEASVKKTAAKLVSEIRSGASFEAVATQFSSGTRGAKSSDPFWVELSQIDPAIAAALAKTQKGSITDPVHNASGYQIVKLIDMRKSQQGASAPEEAAAPRYELAYKKILMTMKPDAKRQEAELLLKLAKEVQQSPGKCTDKTMAGVGDLAALDFKVTLERSLSTDLSDKLRDFLLKLPVGRVSEPVISPEGIHLFMLCERVEMPPSKAAVTAADDAVRQSLYEQKLELEAQKYLRNLRREAFIEVRGR